MRKQNREHEEPIENIVEEFIKGYDSSSSHHTSHHRHRSESDYSSSSNGENHSHNYHHHHHHSSEHHSHDNEESLSESSEGYRHHSHHSPKSYSKKSKSSIAVRVLIIIFAIILLLVLVAVGTVLFLRFQGKNNIDRKKDNVTIQTIDGAVSYDDSGKTVVYKGQKYVYNENVITAVFLGIDDKGFEVDTTDEYGTAGQADTIMAIAYDKATGKISVITIPRDSMTDVDVYSVNGSFARTEKMQICLSFAYGDGGKLSCENTIKSIERVLCGIPIDFYFSLRVRGVDAINNAIGGVELTSLETIGGFVKGEKVNLLGTDARYYVTARDRSKIDSDSLRRKRQIQYAKAFSSKAMSMAKSNIGIVTDLYNTAKQYAVTDITLSSAVYLAGEVVMKSVKIDNFVSLQGKYVESDKYPQFILDEEMVYETILDTFYEKAD